MNVCMYVGEGFSVAFDPLDGSSIVDTNFTVGTIFGVWPGDKLIGVTGRDQVPCLHPCQMKKEKKRTPKTTPFSTNLMTSKPSSILGCPGIERCQSTEGE